MISRKPRYKILKKKIKKATNFLKLITKTT